MYLGDVIPHLEVVESILEDLILIYVDDETHLEGVKMYREQSKKNYIPKQKKNISIPALNAETKSTKKGTPSRVSFFYPQKPNKHKKTNQSKQPITLKIEKNQKNILIFSKL